MSRFVVTTQIHLTQFGFNCLIASMIGPVLFLGSLWWIMSTAAANAAQHYDVNRFPIIVPAVAVAVTLGGSIGCMFGVIHGRQYVHEVDFVQDRRASE